MGQDWSVTRRVMAWKPRMSTDSDTIPVVWTDQARRQPVPSPVNRPTSERIDERRRDVRDTSSGGGGRVGWILLLVVFWPYLVLEAIVTVLVHGAFYVISGVLSVLCTPFVLLARWTGLAPWRIDVWIDGTLVDKQFVRGRAASSARMSDIARSLTDECFRTTAVAEPQHAQGS